MSQAACCPRCGYDQSGVIATWNDSCPVQGLCSECGYQFDWAWVLDPNRWIPDWSFESAHERSLRRALGTALRIFLPRTLWTGLRMEHPFYPNRMLLLSVATSALVGAALLALLFPIANVTWTYRYVFRGGESPLYSAWQLLRVATGLNSRSWIAPNRMFGLTPVAVLPPLWFILVPFTFRLLPFTLRKCRVRAQHIARVVVYEAPSFLAIVFVTSIVLPFAVGVARTLVGGPSLWRSQGPFSLRLVLLIVLLGVWSFWWWRAACRDYLKLPHATGVSLAMTVLGFLLAIGLICVVPGWAVELASYFD